MHIGPERGCSISCPSPAPPLPLLVEAASPSSAVCPGTHSVDQADPDFEILLPQPPESLGVWVCVTRLSLGHSIFENPEALIPLIRKTPNSHPLVEIIHLSCPSRTANDRNKKTGSNNCCYQHGYPLCLVFTVE